MTTTTEERELAKAVLGEGLHTAFRKATDHPYSTVIHKLISEDNYSRDWDSILSFVVDGLDSMGYTITRKDAPPERPEWPHRIDGQWDKISGTSLVGAIDVSYARIVDRLGEPTEGDAYKVDAEWAIEFEDGTVATIYNYKDGVNYLGDEGTPTAQLRDWHIGGKSGIHTDPAVKLVHELFGEVTP